MILIANLAGSKNYPPTKRSSRPRTTVTNLVNDLNESADIKKQSNNICKPEDSNNYFGDQGMT